MLEVGPERPDDDQARRPRRRDRPPARPARSTTRSASRTSRRTTSTTSAGSTCCTATSPSATSRTAQYVVPLPESLREVGVLLEPTPSPRRGSTRPTRSSGASRSGARGARRCSAPGTIGLLAALVLRLRGLEVVCCSRHEGAVPEQRPDRGARRHLCLVAGPDARRGGGGARAVRPHVRGDRVQPARLRGGRGARQERRPRPRERHRRRPQGRGAGRPDQPGLRPRQQGDGRDGQRLPRRLRARRRPT